MIEDELEIEFLIEQMGSGIESVIRTNLGVNAQALRHMGILFLNTLKDSPKIDDNTSRRGKA